MSVEYALLLNIKTAFIVMKRVVVRKEENCMVTLSHASHGHSPETLTNFFH